MKSRKLLVLLQLFKRLMVLVNLQLVRFIRLLTMDYLNLQLIGGITHINFLKLNLIKILFLVLIMVLLVVVIVKVLIL